MKLFNSAKDLIVECEKFNNEPLKRNNDLLLIIKAYNKKNQMDEFERLAFTGKYVNGLFRVLKSSVNIPEVESVDHIKKDLSENLEKVTSQLREIAFDMTDADKIQIEKNYLEMSQTSLNNLQELVADFDDIKKYLNYLKRNESN